MPTMRVRVAPRRVSRMLAALAYLPAGLATEIAWEDGTPVAWEDDVLMAWEGLPTDVGLAWEDGTPVAWEDDVLMSMG